MFCHNCATVFPFPVKGEHFGSISFTDVLIASEYPARPGVLIWSPVGWLHHTEAAPTPALAMKKKLWYIAACHSTSCDVNRFDTRGLNCGSKGSIGCHCSWSCTDYHLVSAVKALHNIGPGHLNSYVSPRDSTCSVRSARVGFLQVPLIKQCHLVGLLKCALQHLLARIALPTPEIHITPIPIIFRNFLKTRLFSQALRWVNVDLL